MVRFISGDVTNTKCNVILHQVNCQGVMGSGVALCIKNKYPEVYDEYKKMCNQYTHNTMDLLGTVQLCQTHDGKVVANLFGQDNYGYGYKHTVESEVLRGLIKLNKECKGLTVAIPYRMGSDRGGANWDDILKMITDQLIDCDVIIARYS